jgi:putative sterol carrier protein
MLPKQTLAPTGAKTVWVKCGKKERERMTVMVMGDIKDNKYSLFLVMKSKPSKIANVAEENRRFRHGFADVCGKR